MTYAEPANMTGIVDIFQYANTVSGNVFGVGILVSLYLIIAIYLKNNGENLPDALMVAGLITSIVGVLIRLMELINNWHLAMIVIIFALCGVWSYFNKS